MVDIPIVRRVLHCLSTLWCDETHSSHGLIVAVIGVAVVTIAAVIVVAVTATAVVVVAAAVTVVVTSPLLISLSSSATRATDCR